MLEGDGNEDEMDGKEANENRVLIYGFTPETSSASGYGRHSAGSVQFRFPLP